MSDRGLAETAALRVTTSDPEEHAAFWRALGAEREVDQLGPGPFRGALASARGVAVGTVASGYDRLVRVRGASPRRALAASIDLGGRGRFRLQGGALPGDATYLR